MVLIVFVIGIGNVVYEFGNLIGVVIGFNVFVNLGIGIWVFILGICVVLFLWIGCY